MDLAAELSTQNDLFATLVRDANPDTEVPTCPGWTLRMLLTHLGRGHRWAATIVRDRADTAVDPKTVADGKSPADWHAAVAWLTDGPRQITEAVAATGPETPVWTFLGPHPSAWWIRRRMAETAVHRADAAIAIGAPFEIAPPVAADCVSEWLDMLAQRRWTKSPLPDDATLHIHATDTDGEWVIGWSGTGVTVERAHTKATVALRGPAQALLLTLMRRIPLDTTTVDVLGERAVAAGWLDATPF